ncbi:ABC-2 family transporter protein [Candidatus Uhrbacteria bacterium]|nr:ABC-2 family transporter protein [Candidatus Uhrbacteria bacterium]
MKLYYRLLVQFMGKGFMFVAVHPLDFWMYLVGKIIRMAFFFVFIFSIFRVAPEFAGYNFATGILIFVTYNFIDILSQTFFFRGLYHLQELVRRGTFDRALTYPISPLFYTAFRMPDPMDFISLVPVLMLLGWALTQFAQLLTPLAILLYILLVANGLLIAFALCTFLASLTFFTQEMEGVWWFYRYAVQVGRYPVEIFRSPFQFILTWVIPLGVMITFPSRALLGILSWQFVGGALVLSALLFYVALSFWRFALRRYSSASS